MSAGWAEANGDEEEKRIREKGKRKVASWRRVTVLKDVIVAMVMTTDLASGVRKTKQALVERIKVKNKMQKGVSRCEPKKGTWWTMGEKVWQIDRGEKCSGSRRPYFVMLKWEENQVV